VTDRVFDSSAVLALIQYERGADVVARLTADGGLVAAVSVIEILTRRIDQGVSLAAALAELNALKLTVVPFDADLSVVAAALREPTRSRGLSLGDRACLALAISRGLPVITADRMWEGLDLGVPIEVVR
jgi:ribonuclease VapC